MKDKALLRFNPIFQRKIFERVISKYGNSFKASPHLQMNPSVIRSYKNGGFKSISEEVVEKLIILKITSRQEIIDNTLETISKKNLVASNLENGRKIRINKLSSIKENIPNIHSIITKDNALDFLRWFKSYFKLLNLGFRKTTYLIEKDFILIKYNNFAKTKEKIFEVKIPLKFNLDKEFSYFFGLWCGDSAGGKRMGIVNQDKKIQNFCKYWLEKNRQSIEKILYVSELIDAPKIEYDKKFILKTDKKGWVLSVHSNNGILSSFFNQLYTELDNFLSFLNLESFFAGLFDAEGNVSLYNHSFRIACKDMEKVRIYSNYLKKIGFETKYDGGCIVLYDLNLFYKKIYPSMKHSERTKNAYFLCTGKGDIPLNFKQILEFVKDNPNCTQTEIAKALKKNKVSPELKLLCDFRYLYHKGYPFRYSTNS